MGDADRRSVVRRTAETNDRMDAHAKVLESLMKVQTAHSATLTDHKNCIDSVARGVKDNEGAWSELDGKVAKMDEWWETVYAKRPRTFWQRLKWIFRGDVSPFYR